MDIHIHLHHEGLSGIERQLDQLHTQLTTQGAHIMAKIDDLNAQIAEVSTNLDTIATNVEEIDGDVKEINQKLTDMLANGIDQNGITQLQAGLAALATKTEAAKTLTRNIADVVPEQVPDPTPTPTPISAKPTPKTHK